MLSKLLGSTLIRSKKKTVKQIKLLYCVPCVIFTLDTQYGVEQEYYFRAYTAYDAYIQFLRMNKNPDKLYLVDKEDVHCINC